MSILDFELWGKTSIIERRLSSGWPEAGGIARLSPGLVGSSTVHAISWVGEDSSSQLWIDALERSGSSTLGVSRIPGTAPTSYLFHDHAGRTMCFFHPGILDASLMTLSQRQTEYVRDSDVVVSVVSPEAATHQMLEVIRPESMLVWVVKADPHSLPLNLRIRLFKRADMVIYSHQEDEFLVTALGTDHAGKALDEIAGKVLIRTAGDGDIRWNRDSEKGSCQVTPISQIIAGQFLGKYLVTEDLASSIELAISSTGDFLQNREKQEE
jgi:sugar/nucleoside kinase (ribokinase family)